LGRHHTTYYLTTILGQIRLQSVINIIGITYSFDLC